MLATRLLRGYVGSVPVLGQQTFTTASDGGWPGNTGVQQFNGVVYFGYVDGSGNVEIRTYTESTSTVSAAFTLHASLETDWHDAPGLTIRSDGRLVVAYCQHSGTTIYVRISTNPYDITAWGSELTLDASLGGFQYTYPNLFRAGSTLYLFYRDDGPGSNGEPSTWCYSTSSDGGSTWAAQTELYESSPGILGYFDVDFDGSRFDFACTDGTTALEHSSVYHFYMEGGLCYKSDGTPIAASLPLSVSDMTLVYDGATSGARFPSSIVCNNGRPAIAFPAHTGGASDYWYCLWSGSAWGTHNVVSDGATGAAWVEGGFVIDYADARVGFLSRSVSSHYQVFRYQTDDGGTTWTSTQISSSASDDFYPVVVRNGNKARAIWLHGSASSALSYSLGILAAVYP